VKSLGCIYGDVKKGRFSLGATFSLRRESARFFARDLVQAMSVHGKCQGVSWGHFAEKARLQKKSHVLQTWISAQVHER
jgi:hypothetical protein